MLTSIWNFLKTHLLAIVLVVVIAVGYGWFRHQQAGFAQTIADINASHQIEMDKISAARAQEAKEHVAELKQLQDSIVKIQADYAAAQDALKNQQVVEVREIVKKYGNDADGLAALFADRMGFVVVKQASQ